MAARPNTMRKSGVVVGVGVASVVVAAHWKTLAKVALSLCVVYAAWAVLAPRHLGGETTYLVTSGSSMEPGVHEGDFVVLRPADSYDVGDVVGYQSAELGRVVVHRIIEKDGGAFVFQGDNNSFVDSERPEADRLVGSLRLRVPYAGHVVGWMHNPRFAAVMSGVLTLFLAGGAGVRNRRGAVSAGEARTEEHIARRKRARRLRGLPSMPSLPSLPSLPSRPTLPARPALPKLPSLRSLRPQAVVPESVEGVLGKLGARRENLLYALAAVAAVSVVLGAWSFSRPTTQIASEAGLYSHVGSFDYSAAVPERGVYTGDHVRTGDPVYTRIVPRLTVTFSYRLETSRPTDVGGTAGMDVELRSMNGWKRVFPVRAPKAFEGQEVFVRGKLDLEHIGRLTSSVEERTQTTSGTYFVTLKPRVELSGEVDGQPVTDEFAPELKLRLDRGLLWLEETATDTELPASLEPSEQGSSARSVPATLGLPPLHPRVDHARMFSLFGAGVGIAGVLLFGLRAPPRRPDEEHELVAARLGELLIDVSPGRATGRAVVELVSLDAMARLADAYYLPVLHEEYLTGHAYLVEKEGVLYRFCVGKVPGAPPVAAAVVSRAPAPALAPAVAPASLPASMPAPGPAPIPPPYAGPERRDPNSRGARFRRPWRTGRDDNGTEAAPKRSRASDGVARSRDADKPKAAAAAKTTTKRAPAKRAPAKRAPAKPKPKRASGTASAKRSGGKRSTAAAAGAKRAQAKPKQSAKRGANATTAAKRAPAKRAPATRGSAAATKAAKTPKRAPAKKTAVAKRAPAKPSTAAKSLPKRSTAKQVVAKRTTGKRTALTGGTRSAKRKTAKRSTFARPSVFGRAARVVGWN